MGIADAVASVDGGATLVGVTLAGGVGEVVACVFPTCDADAQPHLLLYHSAEIAIVLIIDARDLLIPFGDDANLLDRRPVAIDHQSFNADAGCRDSN